MKKFILTLTAMLVMTVSAMAMSYEQARQQALFLTDKMAYELNLTDAQYQAAYEVNLDYLMGVNTIDDLYGPYWQQRNLDLSYILLSWQYRAFCDAAYFYRPLYFSAGYWHFGIYARYPHRDYFFFGRPEFFAEYRGGHSWHMNGGRSWYHGRDFGPRPNRDDPRIGMRNDFNRGRYGNGFSGNPNSATSFGTARRPPVMGGQPGTSFGGSQPSGSFGTASRGDAPSRGNAPSFGNRGSSTRSTVGTPSVPSAPSTPSFGSRRGSSTPSNTFSNGRANGGTTFGGGTTRPTSPQGSGSYSTPRQSTSGSTPGFGSNRFSQGQGSSRPGSFSSPMPNRSSGSFGSSGSRPSFSTGSGSRPSFSTGSGSRPSMSSPAPGRSSGSPSGGSRFGSRR